MHWNITTIIPLVASVVYGVLLLIALFSKPHTRLKQIFSVYLLAMLVWSISAFMTVKGSGDVLFWFRIMTAAPITMMLAIFYFVQDLFAHKLDWSPLVFFYGILVIVVVLSADGIISTAFMTPEGELVYAFSNWIFAIAIPGYSLMIYSLIQLIRGVQLTDNEIQLNRLRYLIIGLSITMGASVVNFTPLGKYPIDIAANVVTALLIAYTILRYQLLDIRLVLKIGLFYSILTTFFGVFYYLVIYLTINIFYQYTGQNIFLISMTIAILTSIVLTPLRNYFQGWLDRIFYRERYHGGLMLQRLSQTTASLLDIKEISKIILWEVTDTLHIERAAIFVKHTSSGDFHLIAQSGLNATSTFDLREGHPIINWLSHRKQILTKHEWKNQPQFKSLWTKEREELEILDMLLYIPLHAKGNLVGILAAGNKRSGQAYSQDDRLILTTLGNQMAVAIENARLYEELESTFVETVVALANAIDLRDTYTSNHSQQIADMAAETARAMQCSPQEIDTVYWGGLLHDIGKIGIPDSILQKPGPLDEEEWDIIRQHPQIGADLVAKINKLTHIAPAIAYSHERFDGSGYPQGKQGYEIPLEARIIAVVDSYSAMVDERSYKPPMSPYAAIEEIYQNAGILFDPAVVEAFIQIAPNYLEATTR